MTSLAGDALASGGAISAINLNLYENFIESIAQVMSRALTDEETEKLLSSFESIQARLRVLSSENLRRLEAEAHARRPFCKHKGTCTTNAFRGWVKSFGIVYSVKYALSFVPALITGQIYRKPSTLIKIGGKDTISFALFMSSFISSYKGFLCLFRRLRGKSDSLNAFFAGCIAGTTIFLDSNPSRRLMIALYLSTRTGHFIFRWLWMRYLQKFIFGHAKPVIGLEELRHQDHIASLKPAPGSPAVRPRSKMPRQLAATSTTSEAAPTAGSPLSKSVAVPASTPAGHHKPQHQQHQHHTHHRSHRKGGSTGGRPVRRSDDDGGDADEDDYDEDDVEYLKVDGAAETVSSDGYKQREKQRNVEKKILNFRSNLRSAMGTLVMMISSSQILAAYLWYQNTLNRSYLSFLLTHGGFRSLVPGAGREYLKMVGEFAKSATSGISSQYLRLPEDPLSPPPLFESMVPPGYPTELAQPFADLLTEHPHKMIMCSMVHPHDLTCEGRLFGEFGKEWWRAMALYAPLNAIMALIFRGPAGILRKPRRFLVSFIKSTLRSTLFLTAYCTIANYVPCKLRNWFGRDRTWFYYVNGLVAGSMVMIEAPGRRLELGMYCLPRAIESFWNCGVEWGWWRHIPGGEGIYFCLATGVLMTLYQQDPETILDGYRKVMYRFFGIN